MNSEQRPVRIVHLQGGLRAIDDRSGQIHVQVHSSRRFIRFEAPEYANLYATLQAFGFRVIGAEFITNRGFAAPDWWFSPPKGQFKLTHECREWSYVRHAASTENKRNVVDITRRCSALLELLGIRVWQMSNAYNGAYLAASSTGELPVGNLFDNTYTPHIEAAIHAFLADAASLRDLMCEFTWKNILKEEGEVRKIGRFMTCAKDATNPLAQELIYEGKNGWIKRLSDLRNDVLHFAPIGTQHTFPPCQAREVQMPQGETVRYLAYGLVDRIPDEGDLGTTMAAKDEEQIIAELRAFANRLDESDDALEYAWDTVGKLIDLCERARLASGLEGEMLTITDKDIVDFQIK